MKNETWEVGSHRSVDRLTDGKRLAICEVYSGAAGSIEQADEFQVLIAAAPDIFRALQAIIDVVGESGLQQGDEWGGLTALELAHAAIAKATRNIHITRIQQ